MQADIKDNEKGKMSKIEIDGRAQRGLFGQMSEALKMLLTAPGLQNNL